MLESYLKNFHSKFLYVYQVSLHMLHNCKLSSLSAACFNQSQLATSATAPANSKLFTVLRFVYFWRVFVLCRLIKCHAVRSFFVFMLALFHTLRMLLSFFDICALLQSVVLFYLRIFNANKFIFERYGRGFSWLDGTLLVSGVQDK